MGSFLVDKWKERLKMLCLLPLPNRSLKYFPPHFIMRDPVVSRVYGAQLKGATCSLLLFSLGDAYPSTSISSLLPANLNESIRRIFIDILKDYFQESDILGVKQFGEEDYCVFVRIGDDVEYGHLNGKTELIKEHLENLLQNLVVLRWNSRIRLQAACFIIEKSEANPQETIRTAYRYAFSLATKKLPADFASYRQQLVQILNAESISIFTQPIMNLESGEVFGWEVLARGPENSPFHNPVELFEFSHQANLLAPMEFLVIRKALQEISRLKIREQVFFNITPVTLAHPLLLDKLLEWLGLHPKVSAIQIIFEITNRHAINDFEQMGSVMASFRAHGFRFAIDDAGSGSSLHSISELIPDIIKIDKSIIRNIDRLSVKQSLLKSLLYFAENINCQVIAEGVESEEEADILCRNRVQMGQGFYFSKPQPLQFEYGDTHFPDLKEKIIKLRKASSA